MDGMYPAVIFGLLALFAVWWFLRSRDAIAFKRAISDIKEHQTAETNRAIQAMKIVRPVKRQPAPAPRVHRDSDEG